MRPKRDFLDMCAFPALLILFFLCMTLAGQDAPTPKPAPLPGPVPTPIVAPQTATAPVSAAQAAAKWAAMDYAKGAAGRSGRLQVTVSTGAFWSGRILEQGAEFITLQTWDGFIIWINVRQIVAITPSAI